MRAKNPSTAKAECQCEIVKDTVEWNFYNLKISIIFFKKSSPKEEQKFFFSKCNLKYIALRKKFYNIMLFYRMLFKNFTAKRTRHFRVIFYLCFKTSPRAKSFTSISVWARFNMASFALSICVCARFHMDSFVRRLVLIPRLKGIFGCDQQIMSRAHFTCYTWLFLLVSSFFCGVTLATRVVVWRLSGRKRLRKGLSFPP